VGSCTKPQQDIIEVELNLAKTMATSAAAQLTTGTFFADFFAEPLVKDAKFHDRVKEVFSNVAKVMDKNDPSYAPALSCDLTSACGYNPLTKTVANQDKASLTVAHASDQSINFCPGFFQTQADPDNKIIIDTEKRRLQFEADRNTAKDKVNLRGAHRTRASVLVHEATHLKFTMLPVLHDLNSLHPAQVVAKDWAYGFNACWELPRGVFNRGLVSYKDWYKDVFCGQDLDHQDVCKKELSVGNADTWAHVAAGIYFTQLGFTIQYPPLPVAKQAAKPVGHVIKRRNLPRPGVSPQNAGQN
jgi:hypothetical protein